VVCVPDRSVINRAPVLPSGMLSLSSGDNGSASLAPALIAAYPEPSVMPDSGDR
jgi:hypothetical protein